MGRISLETGDLAAAARYFENAKSQPDTIERSNRTNFALLEVARGEWASALLTLEPVLAESPDDIVVSNAIAVALLNLGRLKEVRTLSSRC